MPDSLIRPLFGGPIDIVGDVHGEIEPLRSLLARLGYSHACIHPAGRRLVFLGDLTDRGPDSLAVVELVRDAIARGCAQCVLGNHELNLLLNHPKYDNDWFFGRPFLFMGQPITQKLASDADRTRLLQFFRRLPVALHRSDLRVSHAFWDDEMIELVRDSDDVLTLYEDHRQRIELELRAAKLDRLSRQLRHQNDNPVKLLTSGPEQPAAAPYESGGRIRSEERVPWWVNYSGVPCVFGHYAFRGGATGNHSAICIDYGAGYRWKERIGIIEGDKKPRLAALRWPERAIMFDDRGDSEIVA